MKEFFMNPWVISLGTTFVITLIFQIVIHFITKKDFKREYSANLGHANNKILEHMRDNIAKGRVISLNVLEQIVKALSLDFSIKVEHLHNTETFGAILIEEVSNTPYLTDEDKEKYIKLIMDNYIETISDKDFTSDFSHIQSFKINHVNKQLFEDYLDKKKSWYYQTSFSILLSIVVFIISLLNLTELESLMNIKFDINTFSIIIGVIGVLITTSYFSKDVIKITVDIVSSLLDFVSIFIEKMNKRIKK